MDSQRKICEALIRVRRWTRKSQKWTFRPALVSAEYQLLWSLCNGKRNAQEEVIAVKIFFGTNANVDSSTRLTKQLVSVRRPFPQQTNPARRPQTLPFVTNLFQTSFVL